MKLQIVKTDKGYASISDEPIKLGEWYINTYMTEHARTPQRHTEIRHLINHQKDYRFSYCKKIIATDISFKLEGIPQFELPAVLTGAEPTEEKRCYSIEDMRQAYDAGKQRQFWEEDYKDGSKILEQNAPKFEVFIESLNQPKKLVAIEILTRKTHPRADEYTKDGDIIDVPFTQDKSPEYPDGLLTIKQYYYE